MKLSECITDHDVYLVTRFNKSKPDAGVFFSNNYFKYDSALYIFFEQLFIIHIFTEFLCAWVYDWLLGL